MSKTSQLPKPGLLTGIEMLPATFGAGNARIPLSHLGSLPRGAIALSLTQYVADTSSVAAGDPGAGNLRWNHATQASATEIYLNDSDADAVSHATLWSTVNPGGFLYLYASSDLGIWQKWQVTAITDATGYVKFNVTYQGGSGTFADDAAIVLTLQQPTPSPGVDRNVVTVASSVAGVLTLDAALGDYFRHTTTENTSIVIVNAPACASLTLSLIQGSPARTVAYPATARGQAGTLPAVSSVAGARDRIVFTTDDGGANWDTSVGKAFA